MYFGSDDGPKTRLLLLRLSWIFNLKLSTDDTVVSAANKARRMAFHLKRSFAVLNPNNFLPLYKVFIRPYLEYTNQAFLPALSRDAEAWENLILPTSSGDLISMLKITMVFWKFPCSPSSPIRPAQGYAAIPISSTHRNVIPAVHNTHAASALSYFRINCRTI